MQYKKLFIWVEGSDDERFVNKIIKPSLEQKYDMVKVRKYAEWKKEISNNYTGEILGQERRLSHV